MQHQPVTTRTFIAVTSILCYHTPAVISVLPFLISCCLFSFFFYQFTHLFRSSPPPLPSFFPSAAVREGGRKAGGLERACYYNAGSDGEGCEVFHFGCRTARCKKKNGRKIKKCFIDSDPLLSEAVETKAVVSPPPERAPSF